MRSKIVVIVALCAVITAVVSAGQTEFADYLNKGMDNLINQLGSDQWETREKATEDLVRLGLLAKPAVEKALAHPDAEVRERATQIMFFLRWQEPFSKRLDSFISQLKSKNINDQFLLNDVIYFISRGESVFVLFDILKDTSQPINIRKTIAASLRGVNNVSFKPVLNDIITIYNEEKNEEMRGVLIYLMGRGGKDEKVITVLASALNEQSHTIKSAALSTLGEIGDNSAIPEILKVLRGGDNNIKSTALYVLNRFRDESVNKELMRIMKDDTLTKESTLINLRRQAIGMLANYTDLKLIPEFIEVLKKEKDPTIKIELINALSRYRNEKTISSVLVEFYPTTDPAIQPNILSAIQSIGDRNVIPDLVVLLENRADYDEFHRILGTLQSLASNQKFAPAVIPQAVKDEIAKRAREWWDKNKPG